MSSVSHRAIVHDSVASATASAAAPTTTTTTPTTVAVIGWRRCAFRTEVTEVRREVLVKVHFDAAGWGII